MKRRNTQSWCLSVCIMLLSVGLATAQTFVGNIINTAGNGSIPSAGTGGCTVAPQNAGGTVFENTVAGLAANAQLLSVQINLNHTFDSDLDIFLEGPGVLMALTPQRIELAGDLGAGNDNFTNTIFCDNAATSITAGAAPFTGIFRPEGTLVVSCDPDGAGALTAYAGNTTTLAGFAAGQNGVWKLRIFDDVGADMGTMIAWSISFGVPGCSLSGVVLPQLNIEGTDPAVCGATNVALTAPTLPPACSTAVISVFVDGVFLMNVAPGGAVVIPSLTTGAHTVRYQLSACDFVSQSIIISDGVDPVLTCPGNLNINLDPGACNAIVNYDVIGTDNCPGITQSLHQNLAWPQVVDIALVCSNAAADEISYYRIFNIAQNLTATSIDLGVWRATPGSPFTIRLWSLTGALNNANLTNLLSTTVYNPAVISNAATINVPLTPTVDTSWYTVGGASHFYWHGYACCRFFGRLRPDGRNWSDLCIRLHQYARSGGAHQRGHHGPEHIQHPWSDYATQSGIPGRDHRANLRSDFRFDIPDRHDDQLLPGYRCCRQYFHMLFRCQCDRVPEPDQLFGLQ